MTISYKKRRQGKDKPHQDMLMTPRSKRFKQLKAIWRERREAREKESE